MVAALLMVYETIMDGMELNEPYDKTSIRVNHLLIVDAYDTWWIKKKSYLCRMIDMLNMGLVSEVIFEKKYFLVYYSSKRMDFLYNKSKV
ncbi:MAG: hypothetical protein IPL26_07030 [Leptospiraceae bacterium]|nr:hypothetical protein [Leptospiraceae bacterium]